MPGGSIVRVVRAGWLVLALAPHAIAAEQSVRGTVLAVSNPGGGAAYRRKILLKAAESGTSDTIVGDPTIGGAALTIALRGTTPSAQTYELSAGTSPLTHRPFWSGDVASGFVYRDSRGEQSAVSRVQMKISRGTFHIKAAVDGRLGPIDVVPPDYGTDGCAVLAVGNGDSYSMRFADGLMIDGGATSFKIAKPTTEGSCADVVTTTMSTTTSTSITTTTSISTSSTTSTTSSTTTSTLFDVRPVVWLFGDSVTGFYCPLVAQAHPEWNVQCLGVSGEVTSDGLIRLQGALAAAIAPPAVLLIEEGVNDCVHSSGYYDTTGDVLTCDLPNPFLPPVVAANLEAMTDAGRAYGASPIVATTLYVCPVPSGTTCLGVPPNDPGACPGLRCFYDDVCAVSGLIPTGPTPVVDFSLPGGNFLDLLHPNAAGSAVLADRAATAVAAILAPVTTTTDASTTTVP